MPSSADDQHPAAGYPAAAASMHPSASEDGKRGTTGYPASPASKIPRTEPDLECKLCGADDDSDSESTSGFEKVEFPRLEEDADSPSAGQKVEETYAGEAEESDTEYQEVEFTLKSGSEVQKVDVVKIDIEVKLAEARKMLDLDDDSCFLKNGKKVPKDKESKMSLDKVAEDDDDDTKPVKVFIECPPLYGKVSKRAIFITDRSGLREFLYQNKDFTPEQRAEAKVLIVVGGTGAGKTTLLNTLVTYALGVRRHDDFRYRIVDDSGKDQTKSVTSEVTEYYIEGTTRTPPMLIIDTPGFGDCGGCEVDRQIFEKIKETFEHKIDRIHAVCFVGKAPDERLTEFQEYILQNIVKLFGEDVAKNFVTMATFCDGGRVLLKAALEASEFFQPIIRARPHVLFEFNNSAVFNDPKTSGDLHEQFWNMGMTSMERFVNEFLNKVEPSGLQTTRENLQQRKQIEDHVYTLQKISSLLHLQKQTLENEKVTIEAMKHKINQGKSFEYYTEKFESQRKECLPGKMVTHCVICSMTCHDDCPFPNGEKWRCYVFNGGGTPQSAKGCSMCPKSCSYTDHINSGYIIMTVKKKVKMTDSNLKQMYVDATSKKTASEQILDAKQREINVLRMRDLVTHMEIQQSMLILQKVALKKDTYAASAKYYRTLIEREEAKPQTASTLRRIEDLKRNAEYEEQLAEHCSKDSAMGSADLHGHIRALKQNIQELERKAVDQANIISQFKKESGPFAWLWVKIFG